jgi:hypothetical protein
MPTPKEHHRLLAKITVNISDTPGDTRLQKCFKGIYLGVFLGVS